MTRNALLGLLAERGWTEHDLAERAGVGRAHVNEIKNGRAVPRVRTALRIADAFGLPVAAVFPPGACGWRPVRRGRRTASTSLR